MFAPAANDNYRRQTHAERIENAILLALAVPCSAIFWGALAYGMWNVLG